MKGNLVSKDRNEKIPNTPEVAANSGVDEYISINDLGTLGTKNKIRLVAQIQSELIELNRKLYHDTANLNYKFLTTGKLDAESLRLAASDQLDIEGLSDDLGTVLAYLMSEASQ